MNSPFDREPEISIVVPLYNEQENLLELHGRITATMRDCGCDYELVLVNDGSGDATGELVEALQREDPCVAGIHLSRNFGHQAAISAGLRHARGRAVVIMDGDLQDPPEVVPQFIERWQQGYEVVYAIRRQRKEGFLKRGCYYLFYRLMRLMSDLDIPLDSGDFCLLDRQVVDAINALPERVRFVRGLRSFVGFRQCGVRYERAARQAGQPKYTFRKLLRLALDGLLGFSHFPLTLVSWLAGLGVVLTLGWLAWGISALLRGADLPTAWLTVAVMLFFGTMQMVSLGIVSEYLRRIFYESKGRPTYIVRNPAAEHAKEDVISPPVDSLNKRHVA